MKPVIQVVREMGAFARAGHLGEPGGSTRAEALLTTLEKELGTLTRVLSEQAGLVPVSG